MKEEKINLPKDRLNIGLTWFGNVNYPNDEYRSIALKYFKEILSIKNINYYKLSKGIKKIDLDLKIYKWKINIVEERFIKL